MRLDLKIGQIMRKFFLLSFYTSCVCGLVACSTHSQNASENVLIVDNTPEVIDATTNAHDKCGVNGISCNDTPLINYAKTEADFREYGERTKRDHLYTQAGVGNNLTAAIRPTVEEDIVYSYVTPSTAPVSQGAKSSASVTEAQAPVYIDKHGENSPALKDITSEPFTIADNGTDVIADTLIDEDGGITPSVSEGVFKKTVSSQVVKDESVIPSVSEGVFRKTVSKEVISEPENYQEAERVRGELKPVNKLKQISKEEISNVELVCETNCEDLLNDDSDVITSEFTEDSFDIASYIPEDELTFSTEGNKEEVAITTDIAIQDIQISDTTVLTWEAEEGDNLRELLTKWSAMAGWKLLWQTNRNYILNAGVMFKGNFADVSSALIRAFARARPAPIATYYKGNRVIVVETMENENAY